MPRRVPPTPPNASASGCPRARSVAYAACACATASANPGSASTRAFNSEIAPCDSRRETAFDATRHVSQNRVGNGAPSGSNGSLRITSGWPTLHRAVTVNGVVGSRPSCSRTIATSLPRSSPIIGWTWPAPRRRLLALVLDGALVVDLALFALAHELLQARLEVRVRAATRAWRRRILQRLDREVDLAVLLDGDDLRLDDVALAEMLVDVLDVVAVDLGDVHESDLAALERQERPVGGDARDGSVDDRPDLEICQRLLLGRWPFAARTAEPRECPIGLPAASMGRPARGSDRLSSRGRGCRRAGSAPSRRARPCRGTPGRAVRARPGRGAARPVPRDARSASRA